MSLHVLRWRLGTACALDNCDICDRKDTHGAGPQVNCALTVKNRPRSARNAGTVTRWRLMVNAGNARNRSLNLRYTLRCAVHVIAGNILILEDLVMPLPTAVHVPRHSKSV